jgi:hypothetical protein
MQKDKRISKAMRLARRYADGGLFDPTPMNPPEVRTPNERVRSGHQEFEQGYAPAGSMPWEAPRWRRGINSRGQEVSIIKAADGGDMEPDNAPPPGTRLNALDDLLEKDPSVDYRLSQTPQQAAENLARHGRVSGAPDPSEVAMAVMGGPKLGARPPITPIRAYHGSPYDFDKFDLSKIGTGEGAQSYGHGLYFAENPAVAESYKNGILNPHGINSRIAGARADQLQSDLQSLPKGHPDIPGLEADIKQLRDIQAQTPPPRMYEVNINAGPEQFLHYDRAMDKQSSEVLSRLKAANLLDEYTTAPYLAQEIGGNPARSSEMLNEAGVPGIRYLDQGSRLVQELPRRAPDNKWEVDWHGPNRKLFGDYGEAKAYADQLRNKATSNYVVFNPGIVDILKKYGIIGALGGLSQMPQDKQATGGRTMPLKPGSSQDVISTNIKEFHTGPTFAHTEAKFGKERARKQAIAVALSNARKGKANGGSLFNMENLVMRGASYGLRREGMLNSTIPGRTDKIPLNLKAGSYVLPADIPSALGQGNTMAGGEILKKMFSSGPYGMAPMRGAGRPNMPRLNLSPQKIPKQFAKKGGKTEDNDSHVPIVAAGGEYIVHPDVVRDIGHGSMKAGHSVLDKFVLKVRKHHIETLKKLPPPKK